MMGPDTVRTPAEAATRLPMPADRPVKKRGKKGVRKAKADSDNTTVTINEPRTTPSSGEWAISGQSGGRLGSAVVFSRGASFFFAFSGPVLRVHAVETSRVVREITIGQLESAIIFVGLHIEHKNAIYVACEDGRVTLWDWVDGLQLKSYNLGSTISHFALSPNNPNTFFMATAGEGEFKSKTKVMSYSVDSGSSSLLFASKRVKSLLVNKDFLATRGNSSIYIYDFASETLVRHNTRSPANCLAVHPFSPIYAIADHLGKIYIHYPAAKNEVQVLHWHAKSVHALQFSPDGAYLLSGGAEAVLVQWQLSTRHKSFLPRLGGPIDYLSVSEDSKFIGMNLADGRILKVIKTLDLTLVSMLQGLRSSKESLQVFEPYKIVKDDFIVTSVLDGFLQVWDYKNGITIAEYDVAPHNRIMSTHTDFIPMTHIHYTSFSFDGQWMVTLESRDTLTEITMKIWKYSMDDRTYRLNTLVTNPHNPAHGTITSVKFNPTQNMIVVTSTSGEFKLFNLSIPDSDDHKDEKEHWTSLSSTSYRSLPCITSAFTPDGSVLCLSFGHIVTLWDSSECKLVEVLTYPDEDEPILFLETVGTTLLAASHSAVYIWDLLSLECIQTRRIDGIHGLTVDTVGRCKYAILEDSQIKIFDLNKPKSIASVYSSSGLVRAQFNNGHIVAFDDQDRVLMISQTSTTLPEDADFPSKLEIHKKSFFSSIYSQTTSSGMSSLVSPIPAAMLTPPQSPTAKKTTLAFLDNPSHVVPPPSVWLAKFIDSLDSLSSISLTADSVSPSSEDMPHMPEIALDSAPELPTVNKEHALRDPYVGDYKFLEKIFKTLTVSTQNPAIATNGVTNGVTNGTKTKGSGKLSAAAQKQLAPTATPQSRKTKSATRTPNTSSVSALASTTLRTPKPLISATTSAVLPKAASTATPSSTRRPKRKLDDQK